MIKEITEEQFKELVLDTDSGEIKGDNIAVDFYSSTCGPCKIFGKMLEGYSEKRTDYTFYKVCVDDADDLMMYFKLRSMPTFLVVKGGKYEAYPAIHTEKEVEEKLNL